MDFSIPRSRQFVPYSTLRRRQMKKNVRRGFTLPEILVTVTVVAVLAAVVVPAVTQYVSKGDVASDPVGHPAGTQCDYGLYCGYTC